jgi:cystathionine gamma-synthase
VHFETLAVHAGGSPDPATGALVPPIQLSTTFQRSPDGTFPSGYEYIRDANPNRQALEVAMTSLEGGASAVAFASGMAATMAVLQTLAPGDHVVAPLDAYFGTSKLLREQFGPWGLEVSFVDMTDLSAVRAALRPTTRLIWTETPSNPTIAVTDLKGVAEIAKSAGALRACDNTWATPFLQRPLTLGVDLVMHSTTKYLSGHCDVMGGVIVAREAGRVVERGRHGGGGIALAKAPLGVQVHVNPCGRHGSGARLHSRADEGKNRQAKRSNTAELEQGDELSCRRGNRMSGFHRSTTGLAERGCVDHPLFAI